jgi:DNA-binding transcriptional ArsR family regulator
VIEESFNYRRNMPAPDEYGLSDPSLAPAAALMADRARAAMLTALLGGRALAAGELARLAGVQPSTASAHLSRLLDGGLVTVTSRGRQRYYSLAGHEVAAAIEALSQLGPIPPVRTLRQSRQAAALAGARTCYDHLAGRAGVALLDGLLARGFLCATPIPGEPPTTAHPAGTPPTSTPPPTSTRPGNGHTATGHPAAFDVTPDGTAALAACGVDTQALRRSRRRFAVSCLDWTERRAHLGGALGAALTARMLQLGWIERGASRRSVRVTSAGQSGLAATFGWQDPAGQRAPGAGQPA